MNSEKMEREELQERRDFEAAVSESDPRTAILLVPDSENDGYLLELWFGGNEWRQIELSFDEGGHLVSAFRSATNRIMSDIGFE